MKLLISLCTILTLVSLGDDKKVGKKFTNHLIKESSPYLLQHAHNPVDWYPWGKEALAKAKKEGKPIFLSIGYAACHWCHVMEHESFSNPAIAKVLNENFICIKVDREERPDVDKIYMQYLMVTRKSGGWPLNVFLTPELKPFFGGTYFPPESKFGRIGFKDLLSKINDGWKSQRDQINEHAKQATAAVGHNLNIKVEKSAFTSSDLNPAVLNLKEAFDEKEGGFGSAPKFPPSQTLQFLHSFHYRKKEMKALKMSELTLEKMALGGMYDHLGGGFHRYSTDRVWLVPHFEKMLYDNAQLVPVYLEAWLITRKKYYLKVAEETLDYVIRDLQYEKGGYYSSQDADSEKVEGKYYTWQKPQIDTILGKDLMSFNEAFNVTDSGNFDSEDERRVVILNRKSPDLPFSYDKEKEMKSKLLKVRYKRIPPLTDDKVLASWNGMMISAMAQGYRVTNNEKYLKSAVRAAEYILSTMKIADGRLLRSSRLGKASQIKGFLDDHANMIEALLELYQCDFDKKWLQEAEKLVTVTEELFRDKENGGYFFTAADGEKLIARTRNFEDSALPNGNATLCSSFIKLAAITGKVDYMKRAEGILETASSLMKRWPRGYMKLMRSADAIVNGSREIVIAAPDKASAEKWLHTAAMSYHPCQVVLLAGKESEGFLKDKKMVEGKVTAYICYNKVCKQPLTEFAEFKKALGN